MRFANPIIFLGVIVGSAVAVDTNFFGGANCDRGGAFASCTNLARDTCCTPGGNWASSGISFLPGGAVGTVYTGSPACGSARCVGGDGCCSWQPGVSTASWHSFAGGRVRSVMQNVNVNVIGVVEAGLGAWELHRGAIAEDDFVQIVSNFSTLTSEDQKPFLLDLGAVFNDSPAVTSV